MKNAAKIQQIFDTYNSADILPTVLPLFAAICTNSSHTPAHFLAYCSILLQKGIDPSGVTKQKPLTLDFIGVGGDC